MTKKRVFSKKDFLLEKMEREHNLRICKMCGLPENIGRHQFVVIAGGKPITVCEPGYSLDLEIQEARDRSNMLRDLVTSIIQKDLIGFWKRFIYSYQKVRKMNALLRGKSSDLRTVGIAIDP